MTYDVNITRDPDSGQWLADVPALEGTHTYAADRSQLDANVREAIAAMGDLPEGAKDRLVLTYNRVDG